MKSTTANPVKLPDAIHIGFSKCASTFLQSIFQAHPDIFLVYKSYFFSPAQNNSYHKGPEIYASLFENAGEDQVKLESDEHIVLPLSHPVTDSRATTIASVKETIAKISAITGDVRIILVIRNQLDLIVSRYSQYLLGGGKLGFDTYVREQLNCSTNAENYFQNYYYQIIKLLNNTFSPDNVLVILQEEIRFNRKAATDRILKFLGVDTDCPVEFGIKNQRAGLSYFGLRAIKVLNAMLIKEKQKVDEPAKTYIPYLGYVALVRLIRLVDFYLPACLKGNKNILLTDSIRKTVADTFREDNRKLSALLQRDLDSLGYST